MWTGLGETGNTSDAENWEDDILPPVTGANITFDGSNNTAVNNDRFTQIDTITFAPDAGAFTISGGALESFLSGTTVVNNRSLSEQTIAVNFEVTALLTSPHVLGGRNDASTIFSGSISGSGAVRLNREERIGANTSTFVTFSGDNSAFDGTVIINSRARLIIANPNALGTSLLWMNTATAEVANSTGQTLMLDNDIELRGTFGYVGADDFTTTGELRTRNESVVVNNAAAVVTVGRLAKSGTASPGDRLTQSGAGTFVISNAAEAGYDLGFVANSGTTRLDHAGALGSGHLTINQGQITAGTNLTGSNALANSVTVTNANARLGGSFNIELSGNIGDLTSEDPSLPGGLVVDSTATVILSGTNTYTLATQVDGGTLLINGDNSGATGDVTVASGAVLGGTGTIGGATTISGSLRPGNSIGTLTVANDVTWNEGQAWVFELGAGSISDQLAITDGAFLKGSGTTFLFDFADSGEAGIYTLIEWSSTDSFGGEVLGTSFTLDDFDYENLANGLSGTFSFDGNSLNFAVIPEPGVFALIFGVIGVGVTVVMRRRR